METKTVEVISPIETALAKENITNQVIEKLKSDYMGLTINGLDDKDGFKAVEDARKHCKSVRVLASNICKAGREDAIKTQKEWIAKEKEVIGLIEITENHLSTQSDTYKKEQERVLFEAAQKAKLPTRKEKLLEIGVTIEDEKLLTLNDADFEALKNELHSQILAEKAEALRLEQEKIRLEKEENERKEKERLAEVKRLKDLEEAKESARIAAEQNAAQEIENAKKNQALAEQRAKDAEAKWAKEKQEAIEKAEKDKQEAIEKAEKDKQEAIAKLKREQEANEAKELKAKQDAEAKAIADKEAAAELELSKGDKEKLYELVSELSDLKTKYTFKSKKYNLIYKSIGELITKTITYIQSKQ